jgi:hypothetical protein
VEQWDTKHRALFPKAGSFVEPVFRVGEAIDNMNRAAVENGPAN